VLMKQVRALGFEAYAAVDGEDAVAKLEQYRPHIVLTDWFMPGLDGIEVCRIARASKQGRLLYIIMLTAHGDDDRLVEAFEAGADDYLNKPVNVRELHARLRAGKRIVALQTELRRNADNLRALNADLSAANRRLYEVAHLDALTGLPNRRLMVERLQQEWAAYKRRLAPLALILLDVDHFKRVNDEHGHDFGDTVLTRIAQILRREIRAEDTIARMGGEEFLVLTPNTDGAAARDLAERMRVRVAEEVFDGGGRQWSVTASFGVATAEPGMSGWEALFKLADNALYEAKSAGRNRVQAD
jgi:two-component system, cell cycle response regulator